MSQDTLSNTGTGLGALSGVMASIFDGGVDLYTGWKDRIDAVKNIDDETVKDAPPTVVVSDEKSILSGNAKTIIFGSLALIVAGVVIANLSR